MKTKGVTMKTRKLKLNAPLRGHPKDIIIPIRTDETGIPVDRYWRDRLKDAKIDGCVEFLNKPKPKAKPLAETKKKGE